MIFIHINFL